MPFDELPGSKSTKSQIVETLSREWPLSCRKIFNRLSRERGLNITYQAVHKAMLQMLEEGVVSKEGMDYSLNLDWINKIGRFSKDVGEAYLSGKSSPLIEGDVVQHDFERGYDAIEFLLDNLVSGKFVPLDSERIRIVGKMQHMWNPFVLTPADFARMKGMAGRIDARVVCRGDTLLDRVISKFYGALGVKVILGAAVPETPEIVIVGDTIVQIFNPAEMRKIVSDTYERTKSLLSPELIRVFSDISYKPMKVTVLVNRNPLAAKGMREELLDKGRAARKRK